MTLIHRHAISRRGFCLCCLSASAVAATGGWLTPRQAFAAAQGIVQLIEAEAAKAPIAVHRLRGNIAVLEGSGGNIAVLTGPDGKVMVDAGIAVSRPQVMTALLGLGPEPVTHLINTHWHFDHANGNAMAARAGPRDHRPGEHAQAPYGDAAGRGLGLRFPALVRRSAADRAVRHRAGS